MVQVGEVRGIDVVLIVVVQIAGKEEQDEHMNVE